MSGRFKSFEPVIIPTMNTTLFFLRSSEQKIVTDMLRYAARLDEADRSLEDMPQLRIYDRHYGLTHRDLGLYALKGHELAGAAWIRQFKAPDAAEGYVDDGTPVLMIAVKPEFRKQGIGKAMLDQLLLEAGALYERISVGVPPGSPAEALFISAGFEAFPESGKSSAVDGTEVVTMLKRLEQEEVKRPQEGYDPTYWMD